MSEILLNRKNLIERLLSLKTENVILTSAENQVVFKPVEQKQEKVTVDEDIKNRRKIGKSLIGILKGADLDIDKEKDEYTSRTDNC